MSLLTLLVALAMEAFFGEPPSRFHPVAAMGMFIRRAAAHAPACDPIRQLVHGGLMMLAGIALFSLPFVGLGVLIRPYPLLAIIVNALLLKAAFSVRRLLQAGREVEVALEAGDLLEARRAVGWHLVSRETRTLGAGHVASAAVESLAENLGDSFVAPLLAYLVGGLPLAWAYRFVNTADAMIGYHDQRHEYLGKFAARLDDVLNWLPARLSGLLIVLAAPLVGGDWRRAWRTTIAQHGRTTSPNAGWPMSAAAGALGVTLEKIGCYRLEGDAGLPAAPTIARARRLTLAAAGMWVALCALILTIGAR